MNKRRFCKAKTLLLIISIMSVVLSACQNTPPMLTPVFNGVNTPVVKTAEMATRLAEHATPTPVPSATPWPVASSTPKSDFIQSTHGFVNPLTGLYVDKPALLRERPILVKIANWPGNLRPADGLNKADMVFEYFIGAQTNHLVALYYGDDHEHVGPLGPGRVVDARLTEHMQGNLVLASADSVSESVLEDFLPHRYTMRGFAPCPGICTETQAQGGNTFVDTSAIRAFLEKESASNFTPSLFGLAFSETAPNSNDQALRFSYMYADFSVLDWRFDEEQGNYQLWQDHKLESGRYTLTKSEDRGTGEPIAFENVIFLFTNYVNYRDAFYDINFKDGNTEQRGLLLRDGYLYHIRWSAADYDQPFLFYDLDGEPFQLKPGKSWITLSTLDSRLERLDDGAWDMQFIIK